LIGRWFLVTNLIKMSWLTAGADWQLFMAALILMLRVFHSRAKPTKDVYKHFLLCFLYFYTAEDILFKKGIIEDPAKIQFEKAYLGFPNFNIFITSILVIFNTLGSHIVTIVTLYYDVYNEEKVDYKGKKTVRLCISRGYQVQL